MTCGSNSVYQAQYGNGGCCGSSPTYIEVPVPTQQQPNIFEKYYTYSPTTENNQQYTTNNNQQYITNNDYTKKYYTSIFNTNNYHTVNYYAEPKKVGLNGATSTTCSTSRSIFDMQRANHTVTTRPQERHVEPRKAAPRQVAKQPQSGNWVGRVANNFWNSIGGLFGGNRRGNAVANHNIAQKNNRTSQQKGVNRNYAYHTQGQQYAANYGSNNKNFFMNNNSGFINFVDA